ncbi:hypothetical protein, partial [Dickeya oryzae]
DGNGIQEGINTLATQYRELHGGLTHQASRLRMLLPLPCQLQEHRLPLFISDGLYTRNRACDRATTWLAINNRNLIYSFFFIPGG